jgi:hypothetical protein
MEDFVCIFFSSSKVVAVAAYISYMTERHTTKESGL